MKISRMFSSLVLGSALLISLPMTSLAKGPEKKVVDYLSLGDSLAAGVTPYNNLGLGYADYLVERYEQSQYAVDFSRLGVPGATSTYLVNSLPRIQSDIAEADLITINIGANDVLPVLINPSAVQTAMGTVAYNLQVILSTIDSLNPDVDVYVMGYYNPFPYAPQQQQPTLLMMLDNLNQIIEDRADANGDTYVATDTIISKKYESYLPNPQNIHLSAEGYQLLAKEFWKHTDKSKNK